MAAFMAAFFIAPASAQQACGKRVNIVKRLTDVYHERQRATGVASNGMLLETFVSPKGTWTALITYPNGTSCVVAAGENWQLMEIEKPHL